MASRLESKKYHDYFEVRLKVNLRVVAVIFMCSVVDQVAFTFTNLKPPSILKHVGYFLLCQPDYSRF